MQLSALLTLTALGLPTVLGEFLMIETPNNKKYIIETASPINNPFGGIEDRPLPDSKMERQTGEEMDNREAGSDYSDDQSAGSNGEASEKPEEAPENPEETPENPEEAPENPVETPENPEEASENPEEAPENPEEAPENPEEAPENPEEAPENPEEAPEKPGEESQKTENYGTGKECVTVEGPKPNQKCVFPFTLDSRNKTYNECTRDLHEGQSSEYWCSTEVNEEGLHKTGHWGECSKDCPGVKKLDREFCVTKNDFECFFPHSLEGYTLLGCVMMDGIRKCLGKNRKNSEQYDWGECPESCPKDELIGTKVLKWKEIAEKLKTENKVYTSIEREGNCTTMLEKSFESEKTSLGSEYQEIPTALEALENICLNADYCKGEAPGGLCGEVQVFKRFNKLKDEETGAVHKPKSDCRISCSDPKSAEKDKPAEKTEK